MTLHCLASCLVSHNLGMVCICVHMRHDKLDDIQEYVTKSVPNMLHQMLAILTIASSCHIYAEVNGHIINFLSRLSLYPWGTWELP